MTLIDKCVRGIGMTARNVPKVMDGTKTQTRRIESVLRGLQDVHDSVDGMERLKDKDGDLFFQIGRDALYPKYQVGDLLYIKEALENDGGFATYKCDEYQVPSQKPNYVVREWKSDDGNPWKNSVIPARYMPRSAARTFIEITDVRCERIQDITESDAKAEGANRPYGRSPDAYDKYATPEGIGFSHKLGFQKLWNETNGKDAWERNDWVFAYTFEVVKESPND